MQRSPVKEPKPSPALPLLVLRVESLLTQEQKTKILPALEDLAKRVGAVAAIEQPGSTVRMEANPQALLDTSLALTESVNRLVKAISLQTETMQELIEALQEEDDGEEDEFTTLDGR